MCSEHGHYSATLHFGPSRSLFKPGFGLTSPLVASTEGNNELVGFVGKLIAVVVPNLNIFNVQSAVDAGNQIPVLYLAGAFNYLVCFTVAVWMLAMLLFDDRDLA